MFEALRQSAARDIVYSIRDTAPGTKLRGGMLKLENSETILEFVEDVASLLIFLEPSSTSVWLPFHLYDCDNNILVVVDARVYPMIAGFHRRRKCASWPT